MLDVDGIDEINVVLGERFNGHSTPPYLVNFGQRSEGVIPGNMAVAGRAPVVFTDVYVK